MFSPNIGPVLITTTKSLVIVEQRRRNLMPVFWKSLDWNAFSLLTLNSMINLTCDLVF